MAARTQRPSRAAAEDTPQRGAPRRVPARSRHHARSAAARASRRPGAATHGAPAPRRRKPSPSRAVPRRLRRGLARTLRIAAATVAVGALCAGAYAAALDTSMFALRSVVLVGGTARVDAEVRSALAPELGRSLLRISGAAVDRAAAALPDVVSLRFVRFFPHTLRVYVTPERPVLLVRRGRVGFVVSARGRVMAETRQPLASPLPRLWIAKGTPLTIGETLRRSDGLLAAAAAAALVPGAYPGGVRFVTVADGDITLLTPHGFQIRLGDVGELRLKLTIAERIVGYAGAAISQDAYVDVSVPQRPVLDTNNSQVASTG